VKRTFVIRRAFGSRGGTGKKKESPKKNGVHEGWKVVGSNAVLISGAAKSWVGGEGGGGSGREREHLLCGAGQRRHAKGGLKELTGRLSRESRYSGGEAPERKRKVQKTVRESHAYHLVKIIGTGSRGRTQRAVFCPVKRRGRKAKDKAAKGESDITEDKRQKILV